MTFRKLIRWFKDKLEDKLKEETMHKNQVTDLTDILAPYRGKSGYLAVTRDYSKVIAYGEDLLTVSNEATKLGYKDDDIVLMSTPSKYDGFV